MVTQLVAGGVDWRTVSGRAGHADGHMTLATYAHLVASHSSARREAEALGLADALAAFPREDSATADALTYCDMTTSPTGQRVTLDDRLAGIAERYGAEHLVVRCLQRAHDHLAGAVRRTEERLRAGGVPE